MKYDAPQAPARQTWDEAGHDNVFTSRGKATRSVWGLVVAVITLLSCVPAQALANEKGAILAMGGTGSGSTGGLMNTPKGVAVNQSTGNIYVADEKNNRISEFSSTGAFIRTWGQDVIVTGKPNNAGTGFEICDTTAGNVLADCKIGITTPATANGGMMSAPQGVAVDQATGNVYVADQGNRRIQEFSANGSFIRAFGWDVISSGKANDKGTSSFEICDTTAGNTAADCKTAAAAGVNAGQFGGAIGNLALGPGGNVLVADPSNNRVQKFSAVGAFMFAFGWNVDPGGGSGELETCIATCQAGVAGANVGQFSSGQPTRLAVDSGGAIYTVESAGNSRVQKFSPAGTAASLFNAASLSGAPAPTEVGVNTSNDHVFVVKACTVVLCPDAVSATERRIKEFDNSGSLVGTDAVNNAILVVNGFGVNSATGDLLVSSTTGGHRVYLVNKTSSPLVTMDPVTIFAGSTATFSGTVNPTGLSTTYHFEYSKDGVNWVQSPDVSLGFSDNSTHPVSLSATGLTGSQFYHVRLVATKHFLLGTANAASATSSETTFTTTAAKPGISGERVSQREDRSATLEAGIDPQHEATTYHFEYIDDPTFQGSGYTGAISVPVPEASAGSGGGSVVQSKQITGLQPGTLYHFRAVATNPTGTTVGTDHTFKTFADLNVAQSCPNAAVRAAQNTAYLPDCRAIELVNSPNKGNQNALSKVGLKTSPMSADGNKVIWTVFGGTPGGTTGVFASFVAERSAAGWVSKNVVPSANEQIGEGLFAYVLQATTPDLSHFVFNVGRSQVGGLTGPSSLVRIDEQSGGFDQNDLKLYSAPLIEVGDWGTGVDLTDNGKHVFQVDDVTRQLEDVGSGTPELLSLMPGGSASACGLGFEGESFIGRNGPGSGAGEHWQPGYHMVASTDGSRVYFETRADGACAESEPLGLYLRNRETNTTTLIDANEPKFIRASADGRSGFFTTKSALSPGDINGHNDVYRWDEASASSTCLTCVTTDANVEGPVLISNDLSHIYFVSKNQLDPGHGTPGDTTVYALSGGVIRFVGDFTGTEKPLLEGILSANGDSLLVQAVANPTLSSDSFASKCVLSHGGVLIPACIELYRYDDDSQSVECISCLHGDVNTYSVGSSGTEVDGTAAMSADGKTVAFVTAQQLVPKDVNNDVDVYEWRDGVVRLISDGVTAFRHGSTATTGAAPQIRAVDADGSNILFSMVDPGLTGFEQDGVANLYDARIDGGFLPPTPPVHCDEESCQGPLQPAPAVEAVGSSGFRGPGNKSSGSKSHCARKHGKAKQRCLKKHRKRAAKSYVGRRLGGSK